MSGHRVQQQPVWCPYTDTEIPWSETAWEHVVPLSLGGVNRLRVRTDKKANWDLGSKIDARLSDDIRVKQRRNQLGMTGHSGKHPAVTFKRSELESGEPVQVTFDRGDVRVWCPRQRRNMTLGTDLRIRSRWSMNVDTPLRFAAKVALSAGYFVYGDLFRDAVAHDEIRFLMELDLAGGTPEEKTELRQRTATMGIRAEDWLRADDNPDLEVFRLLSQAYGGATVVGSMPTKSSLTVFVGVLGPYIGLVDAPADTTRFPFGATHDLGHVMVLRDGKIEPQSLRNSARMLRRLLQQGWQPGH